MGRRLAGGCLPSKLPLKVTVLLVACVVPKPEPLIVTAVPTEPVAGVSVVIASDVVVPVVGVAFSQSGRVLGSTLKNTAGVAETDVVAGV